jgi:hypothetical protein
MYDKNSRIYTGKTIGKNDFLIDTEGGEDTDEIYEKIKESDLSTKYLFRWFFNPIQINEKEEILFLISEIDLFIAKQENFKIFNKPEDIKKYLLKIRFYLQEPLGKNWTVLLEAH